MKKIFFVLLLPVLTLNLAAQSDIDVLHYKFDINLNDKTDSLDGWATIKFIPLENISTISLDLTSLHGSKGMSIISVMFNLRSSTLPKFSHEHDKLTISKPGGFKKGDTSLINIFYKGIPSDGLIISKNKYGNRTFFADNWPNRGHNWLPCVDDPADKASVEFIVTAPQHYQVVANGIQIEETNLPANKKRTHWKEDVPISTKVMVIGVADFAVNLSGVIDGCIPVYSWVYPEDRDKGFYDYAQAAEILPWFIKHVGPYAYKKLANVQSKTTFGGLENANTIFYSESSVSGTRKSEGLITHEIAHQWFGNMATEKTFAHLWLSEGFATYMTILYMEEKYGIDTALAMLKEDRDQVIAFAKTSKRPVVDDTKDYMALLNANSYQKGGWVLHMLRSQLGDSIFWQGIRQYYATYAGSTAGTDDLRKVFEAVSGRNLETFFQQWLYTAGIPKLRISWKEMPAEKKVAVTIEQLQDDPFVFPLQLQLISGLHNNRTEIIQVSHQKETFYLPTTDKLVEMKPDPRVTLLFDADVTRLK